MRRPSRHPHRHAHVEHRNLRRRSASSPGPGELPLDPDLPPADAFQAGHHHPLSSNDDISLAPPPGSDQSLFWVPAHLHPELAPGEFRAFLREHTQVNPTAVDSGETGEASLSRSPSWLARSRSLSGGLGRQKSMLSRQYTPRHGDKVEEEQTPQLARRGSNRYAGRNIDTGPTLQELQNLEELVKNAEDSGDPNEMRRALRRSSMTFTTGGSCPCTECCFTLWGLCDHSTCDPVSGADLMYSTRRPGPLAIRGRC